MSPHHLVLAGLLLLAPAAARGEQTVVDPRATALADRVLEHLGGAKRWNELPAIAWSFGSSVRDTVRSTRRHVWNKHDGRHRVEGVLRDGTPFVFTHVVGDTLHGHAWLAGREIAGDSLRMLLRRAHAMWTNDSYWLLMPYKLRDPGVRLEYAGRTELASATFERLALRFDRVGLTPGDRYWIDVDPVTHRIERWDFILEGQTDGPRTWTWEGWEQHAGLWFPTIHRQDETVVFTKDIRTPASTPAELFDRP